MQPTEFVSWLKEQNLFDVVNSNFSYFKKLFTVCLEAKKENVLIIGDYGSPTRRIPAIMTGCYLIAAKRMGMEPKLVVQEPKLPKQSADLSLIRALDNFPSSGIVCMALSGKLGSMKKYGKSFRGYVKENNHRFVSTPGLAALSNGKFSQIMSAINIDYMQMQRAADKVKEMLDYGKEVQVITDKGTNLKIDITHMKAIANDGRYGSGGGNIPTGEVYIPPRGKGVNGKIVIDGSVKTKQDTFVVRKPVTLTVEDGSVTHIEGDMEADVLKETLDWAETKSKHPDSVRRISELGIGINPGAMITDANIISEKTLGTCHVALGSNAWFGGNIYSIIHLDQVIRAPKIWVDNERMSVPLQAAR